MPVKSKAQVFSPNYNQEPGMNDPQKKADSQTFKVPVEMLTGGVFQNLQDVPSGPQVGAPYDGDAMGEERMKMTYPSGGKGKMPKA